MELLLVIEDVEC